MTLSFKFFSIRKQSGNFEQQNIIAAAIVQPFAIIKLLSLVIGLLSALSSLQL